MLLRREVISHAAAAAMLLAGAAALAHGPADASDAKEAEFIKWATENAAVIQTADPGSVTYDLSPLGNWLGDARVVALGEATRSSHEFMAFKHRMLRYLVENHGFTAFALEVSLPEAVRINDYVQGGDDVIEEALRHTNYWNVNIQEYLDLIEWMRTYNADKEPANRIAFYGFDMQVSESALAGVFSFLERIDPRQAEETRKELAFLATSDSRRTYHSLSADQLLELDHALDRLVRHFDFKRKEYMWKVVVHEQKEGRSGSEDEALLAWDLARQHAVVARQANTMYRAKLPPETSEQFESRDRGMAENLRWIVDRENRRTGGKGKVVASGFNAHVQRSVLRNSIRTMGVFLAEHLKTDGYEDGLRSVGMLFDKGGTNAYHAVWMLPPEAQLSGTPLPRGVIPFNVDTAPAGTVDASLAKVGKAIFGLNLRDAPKTGPVADWLNTPRSIHSIGLSHADGLEAMIQAELGHDAVRIAEAFDWVVFFREVTPATLMP